MNKWNHDPSTLDSAPDNELEPLPGQVVPQFIRCGKPGCRCQLGHRHGPYFYRVWRGESGEVRKAYVRLEDVPGVQVQTRVFEQQKNELQRLAKLRLEASVRLRAQRSVRRKLLAWLASN